MYLKEIEISGFKSFADKINITLDNDITSIVGPNGSGKSNIVDAIRWVLGEQSVKALRTDNAMSEVIFAGSKNRKPSSVAYVSLTFDNTDHYLNIPYTEVSIKRRVYKTGENEYFLNKEKCRLKDITDLFLDSGVSKESSNIISQGEIGKILSNTKDERRAIFEEASGVLKYKKRKEEALKKLDRTNENLSRINDIINEIEIQIAPLKEQSEKAKEYVSIKEKLKNVEVGLLATLITETNTRYTKAKIKIDELNNQISSLSNLTIDAKLESMKLSLIKEEEILRDLTQKILELTREEESLNSEKKLLQERSKYKSTDIKIHQNLTSLKEEKLKKDNAINLLDKDIEDIKLELTSINTLLEEKTKTVEKEIIKKKNLIDEYNKKNLAIMEATNKIQILNNELESSSTINTPTRRVLNNPKLKGIIDVFNNLISTKEEYLTALEVTTTSCKSFIITENEKSAKDAISYLKENNLGRATFFPLDTIKSREIDYDTKKILDSDPSYIGPLSSIVEYDKKYENIITNQLGNVILVKDINSATRISHQIRNRYRIVTLEGDIINTIGSITGGSTNINRSNISVKQELLKLDRSLQENKIQLETLEKELTKKDEEITKENEKIQDIKNKLQLKNTYLTNLEEEKTSVIQKMGEITIEIDSLSLLEKDDISKEEDALTKKYYEKVKEKDITAKEIETQNRKVEELKDQIQESEASSKINNASLRTIEKELKEIEISVSKMDVNLDNYLNILSEDYELSYEKAMDNYQLDIDIKDASSKVVEYKNILKDLGIVNILSIEEYEKVSTRYNFLNNQKNDLLNAKEMLFSIIGEMDEVMKDEFIKTFNKIEVEFSRVFKQLFNGGEAMLKLTDPTNILETGIEIIASPAGKNLKSLSVLSGGEKTLTAISLLFSILNVRKVPFCIFDEVEAALDEANVDIFGKYLYNYKDKTQFLLITHKKRTMEYAKTLYGITMQESGVSKLVSVRLEEI